MEQESSHPRNMNLQRTDAVDLLEIYHARQLRRTILKQLERLAEREEWPRAEGPCVGELTVFYEMLLLNAEHLLSALGDPARS
ncbi:MAG: hypothetical protein AB8B93_19510 [Pseudomonadales bacterium]